MHSDSELSPVTSQHGQKPPSDLYGSTNISHRRTTARRRYLPPANQYSKPRAITSSGFGDRAYREIIDKAPAQKPDRLIVLVSPSRTASPAAHYYLSSHDPKQLLDLLVERFGVPD